MPLFDREKQNLNAGYRLQNNFNSVININVK